MSAKGYTRGEWSGLPQFACERCGYSVADKDEEKAEAAIRRHVAKHLGLTPDVMLSDDSEPEQEPEEVLGELSFTAAAAELFAGQPDEVERAVALYLLDRKPTGATGDYTKADVQEAIAAVTTEE